nr:PREDICTED: uncharacterized protein LOC103558288 [Equus przewalskii]
MATKEAAPTAGRRLWTLLSWAKTGTKAEVEDLQGEKTALGRPRLKKEGGSGERRRVSSHRTPPPLRILDAAPFLGAGNSGSIALALFSIPCPRLRSPRPRHSFRDSWFIVLSLLFTLTSFQMVLCLRRPRWISVPALPKIGRPTLPFAKRGELPGHPSLGAGPSTSPSACGSFLRCGDPSLSQPAAVHVGTLHLEFDFSSLLWRL